MPYRAAQVAQLLLGGGDDRGVALGCALARGVVSGEAVVGCARVVWEVDEAVQQRADRADRREVGFLDALNLAAGGRGCRGGGEQRMDRQARDACGGELPP